MSDSDSDSNVTRRWLLRLLIGLAIGIPILIEAVTFFGLVSQQFDDDDGQADEEDGVRRVGVGDELFPETSQTETITGATIRTRENDWLFTLEVTVDNNADRVYELRFETVTTGGGTTVSGGGTTGQIAADGSGTVTAEWEIPPGSTPEFATAVVTTYPEDGPADATRKTVFFTNVPVRGS